MVVILIVVVLYLLTYAAYIGWITAAFSRAKPFEPGAMPELHTKFSVVVPFRDEAQNLPDLLESLQQLEYPQDAFELIFINDASSDASEKIINQWRLDNGGFATTLLGNLRLSASPKKDAITRAISIAKGDFIITTDADCMVPPTWLSLMDAFARKTNARMIAASVFVLPQKGFLNRFQQLDFLSLQATTLGTFTLGKPFMCNAANFAYQPSFFKQLGGFQGNDNFAGGDDVFLLQKAIETNAEQVGYLLHQGAVVKTKAMDNFSALIWQRVRWASKAKAYQAGVGEQLSVVVLSANVLLTLCFVGFVMGNISWPVFAILAALKWLPDVILLQKAAGKFRLSAPEMFLSLPFYPIFTCLVALCALSGKFSWKGRQFTR